MAGKVGCGGGLGLPFFDPLPWVVGLGGRRTQSCSRAHVGEDPAM